MSTGNVEELVERVVEVTGTSKALAQHLLGASANDVEAAVALYFEQGGELAENNETASADVIDVNADGEDDVRAPIAPIREQLIGPEDDNFFGPAATSAAAANHLARVTQRVKMCPLRDFAREGALMEEQLQAAATAGLGNAVIDNSTAMDNFGPSHSRIRVARRTRAAAMVTQAQSELAAKASSSRLGDLFRPPTDIAYAGSFQTARIRATELKHWLLVNVQSDNFNSQLLNRDVWSDKELRKLIRRQFMLWQIDADSSEGRRFVAFYHCAKLPYVCVIDPRTGEEVWKSAEPKQNNLLPDLQQFLCEHKDFIKEFEDNAPGTSKRHVECINLDDDVPKAVAGEGDVYDNTKKRTKLLELSEEEQIALAIKNSMHENGNKGADDDDNGSETGSVEEFVDDDTKSSCEHTPFEEQLGTAKNELTMLKLRLLNADGVDEIVQLRWPSDTRLHVLRLYIAQQHAHLHKRGYKLICAFPRKQLEAEHYERTLKELGLHPSANLHVTDD